MLPARLALAAAMATALTVGLSACAPMVQSSENNLAAAGFRVVPADNPKRIAALKSMPPHKLTMQIRNNTAVWVYADPTMCNCLYVGDQIAYDTYRRLLLQKQMADEVETAALANVGNANAYPFQWDAWGPGTPYY